MEVYTQPYNFSHHHIFTHPTTPRAQVLREAHELGQIDQWVVWRWGRPKDNGKRPKLPINPHTGDQADTTNPRTWASITQATTAVEKYDCTGIGFVFTRKDDFAGVDLDDCVENGEVAPWAMEIVEKLASYTELSPSGTGLKIWVKASKPGDRCKNKTGDIEIYDSGRFFTFTGERFAGDKVEQTCSQTLRSMAVATLRGKRDSGGNGAAGSRDVCWPLGWSSCRPRGSRWRRPVLPPRLVVLE